MWSYWIRADEHRGRLLERERAARRRLVYEEAVDSRGRSLRERLDASRTLLSRRERRLLGQEITRQG